MLHSPIVLTRFYTACEPTLISRLQAHATQFKPGAGARPWPLKGGTPGTPIKSYDVLITVYGHRPAPYNGLPGITSSKHGSWF